VEQLINCFQHVLTLLNLRGNRPMTQLLEITGRYLATRYSFDSADPSQPPTIIADIHSPETSGKICVKGAAAPHELSKDLDYRFYGSWTNYFNKHKRKNERQFRFNSFVRLQPAGREAIIGYLIQHGSGFGLGKQRATRLWELFGSEAVTIARTDPERTASELTRSGLSYRAANAHLLAESLESDHATEAIKLDLTGLVTGRGFPRTIINTVIQEWGNKAATIVRRDPYRLLKFGGCGFKKCDSMYLDLGHNPARLKRQALCAWYSLAQNTEGHTWFGWRVPDAYLRSNISGAGVKVERALELAVRAKLIMEVRTKGPSGPISQDGDVRWFAEYEKAMKEMEIAERVG